LSITLPGATAQVYNSSDIYGHRLSIFFNSSYVPTLYLDGSTVVSGSASTKGTSVGVTFAVTIPWATWASYSHTQNISAQTNQNGGSGGYIVMNGWDQVGRGMIEKHRKLLNQAIAGGATTNSESALGESLEVEGYTWLAENAAQQQLSDQLLGTKTEYMYGVGIVGEAVGTSIVGPYVDLPMNFIDTPSRLNGASTQTAPSLAAFLDASGTSSSFESASLEQLQMQVSGFQAASTVKLIDIALQNGNAIYDINSSNWGTIEPLLAPNYNINDLTGSNGIGSWVSGGYRVIAPSNGKIAVGQWTGVGYKAMKTSGSSYSYGEEISGGLSGGFSGTNVSTTTLGLDAIAAGVVSSVSLTGGNDSIFSSFGIGGAGLGGDPLDLVKGSYQYKHDDLTTGAKGFPYGLSFERSYDSGAQGSAGPLGSGWTHNYAITATVNSDGFTGMGQASPLSAVRSIVALYVSSDLVNGQTAPNNVSLENFVLETVVNRWFTDSLTGNVVNVSQGWNSEEFTLMADGSYAPPLGSATILDGSSTSLRYRTKTGVTMNFNSSGQVSSWSNAAGASVSFSYTGGVLSSISNSATGRSLSLSYSGSQISSVTDGTRTVSYGYSSGNLTSFTDALTQKTTFAYDTSGSYDTTGVGHLTQVYYPSNPSNAFVTNFYDGLGRVFKQNDALGNQTQAFFAGSRTEIDDPVGNRHVWYSDPRGNVLEEIQDYGPSPHLNITVSSIYNAQSVLLTTVMPEGNYATYTYDSLFNPLTITQTPKPGSPLSPRVQRFTYTTPVSSLPNFEEVYQSTDPNGNVNTFAYNSTGTVSQITQPTVSKPGVGSSAPIQTFTYTSIGLPQTATDAEGRVTRYDYYSGNADQVQKLTVDYNNLKLVTQYGYDSYGDVNSVTDANLHTTTSIFDALRRVSQVNAAVSGVQTNYTYYPDGQVHTTARQVSTGSWETTQYTYTLADNISVVTDPLGNTTTTTYDADDRALTLTQQVSATMNRQRTYSYDALSRLYQLSDTSAGSPGTLLETHSYTLNGNPLSFIDANSHTTSNAYDGFDRLSQTTYPDATTELYTYDANGNTLQKTVRSGQTIVFTYDALNRASTKTPQNEAAGQVSYGYDLTGRLLQASDGSSTAPYQVAYDTAGRANSYTDQQGRNTQVQYDGVGNRTRLQWPANTNGSSAYYVTYQYDAMNRMSEIDQNGSTSTPLAKYQWDLLSRQSLITYGDGTTDSYSNYDAGDNLQTLTQTFAGANNSVTFSYGWQKNHQRASTGVSNGAFQYIPTVGTTSYGTANANNGYTTAGGSSLTYDGNQNLTFDGVNTLTYDAENRLVQAQNAAWGTSTYLYDPLGHRKQKQVTSPGWQVTTQFVLAGNEEIADYNGTGAGAPLMMTVRGAGGLPVAAITPAEYGESLTAVYYHHDVMGSTVAVTQGGDSGASEAYTYSDFGAPGAGSWATYRYAGYRYDNETGLYYVNARYYNPNLGRFLQTDPIGLSGGRNLYAYVGNDPLDLVDPGGLAPGDVYAVTPAGVTSTLNVAGQQTIGGTTGIGYSHLATEIGPINGVPYVAQENPGTGANIQPLSNFMNQELGRGSEVDVYSPNTPYTSGQISQMTDTATNMIGTSYNYDVFSSAGTSQNGTPSAMQCAEYANYLATTSGGQAPLAVTPFDSAYGVAVLPSNLSNSTSFSYQGTNTSKYPNMIGWSGNGSSGNGSSGNGK
jgi:RHS repeat-associated protein